MKVKLRGKRTEYYTVWELFHLLVPDKIDVDEFEDFLNSDVTVYLHTGDIDGEAVIDKDAVKLRFPKSVAEEGKYIFSDDEYELYIEEKRSEIVKKKSTHQSEILTLKELQKPIEIKYNHGINRYFLKSHDYSECEEEIPPLYSEDKKGDTYVYHNIHRLYIKKKDFEQVKLKYPILCDSVYAEEVTIKQQWEVLLESGDYTKDTIDYYAIKAVIEKCDGKSASELIASIYQSNKKYANPEKQANILKERAKKIAEKHNLPMPEWDTRKLKGRSMQ